MLAAFLLMVAGCHQSAEQQAATSQELGELYKEVLTAAISFFVPLASPKVLSLDNKS